MKISLTDPNEMTCYYSRYDGSFVIIRPNNQIAWCGRCRVGLEWSLKTEMYPTRIGFRIAGINIKLMRTFWSKILRNWANHRDSQSAIVI